MADAGPGTGGGTGGAGGAGDGTGGAGGEGGGFSDLLPEGEGIYSSTISFATDGMLTWSTVSIERSPSSGGANINGYVMVSRSESVSQSGVSITEVFVPKFLFGVKTPLIVVPDGGDGPSTGIYAAAKRLSITDMKHIAENAFNPYAVFNIIVEAAGIESDLGGASVTDGGIDYLQDFADVFSTPVYAIMSLIGYGRLTLQTILATLYKGAGLMLIQTGPNEWKLMSALNALSGTGVSISTSSVVSFSSTFDYTKIPKTQSIYISSENNEVTDQTLVSDFNASTLADAIAASGGNEKNMIYSQNTRGSELSAAMGSDMDYKIEPVPLIYYAKLQGGVDEFTCGQTKTTYGLKSAFIRRKEEELLGEGNYVVVEDKKQLLYHAKRCIYMALHKLADFRIIINSSRKEIVVDVNGITPIFTPIEINGEGFALQKAIITSGGVSSAVETASVSDEGIVVGSTIVKHAGLTTASITYVSVANTYGGAM